MPLMKTPALSALFLQFLSFFLVCVLQLLLWHIASLRLSPWQFACSVGGIAAALSYLRAMRWWWVVMQLVFVPGLLSASSLQLPAWLFLLAFLLMLGVYGSTYRTQVPLYFSGSAVWQSVAALVPPGPVRVIDIGSGIGGLVLSLADACPQARVSGIEMAPLPWLVSKWRARRRRSAAQLLRGDYQTLDFALYDVVFAYLSPAAMPGVWQKAKSEMRPGTLLLSYDFAVDGEAPNFIQRPRADGPNLYGWIWR